MGNLISGLRKVRRSKKQTYLNSEHKLNQKEKNTMLVASLLAVTPVLVGLSVYLVG